MLLSDGEDTGGPDAVAAAELAADAGVHIETIGVGTVAGTTIEVDGFQVATALNEDLLTAGRADHHRLATTGPSDAAGAQRRSTSRSTCGSPPSPSSSSSPARSSGSRVLLLTIGGLLMITWFGRIL